MNCHHLQMIIPYFYDEILILYQLKLCRSRLSWWPARATCSAEVGPGDTVTTEVGQPLVSDFTNLTGGLPAILHELNTILTIGWFTLGFIGQKSGCPAEKIMEKTDFDQGHGRLNKDNVDFASQVFSGWCFSSCPLEPATPLIRWWIIVIPLKIAKVQTHACHDLGGLTSYSMYSQPRTELGSTKKLDVQQTHRVSCTPREWYTSFLFISFLVWLSWFYFLGKHIPYVFIYIHTI